MEVFKFPTLIIFLSHFANAQVVADRFGFINSIETISDNGLQVEAGQATNEDRDLDFSLLQSSKHFTLRQGITDLHEFRMEFHLEDNVDSSQATGYETNFEWFSLGVKI